MNRTISMKQIQATSNAEVPGPQLEPPQSERSPEAESLPNEGNESVTAPAAVLDEIMLRKPVSQLPPFVTSEELEKIESLEEDLAEFDRQRDSLLPTLLEKKFDISQQTYASEPSAENFALLRDAALAVSLVENQLIRGSVLAVVEASHAKMADEKLRPFIAQILETALADARKHLEAVLAEESARHKEFTAGEAFTHSGIVDAAKRPVAKLEEVLNAVSKGHSIAATLQFLRAHAVK